MKFRLRAIRTTRRTSTASSSRSPRPTPPCRASGTLGEHLGEIDAARIEFRTPEWRKFLNRLAGRIREDLDFGGQISLHPYKLLLYGKGGHFRAHRDTEKLGR